MDSTPETPLSHFVSFLTPGTTEDDGSEREALDTIDPKGFFIRHPPKPHELKDEITSDADLFQTIHMGTAVVDAGKWKLVVEGLVEQPLSVSFAQLRAMPSTTVTAFHECYGSPIAPPVHNVLRIGNVRWTVVQLAELLNLARPKPEAQYVWSQGLESGSFGGVTADRYEKDVLLDKALRPEVLVAYEMNGKPLGKKRGGPVRLIVPGWFGTNSTKWLSRLSLQGSRATGPFTTTFYNEIDPPDPVGQSMRPVWMVEPNSMIVRPPSGAVIQEGEIDVLGRAWGCEEIQQVELSLDAGRCWLPSSIVELRPRHEYEWQLFRAKISLPNPGRYTLAARATDEAGVSQPLSGRRNHMHTVSFEVLK